MKFFGLLIYSLIQIVSSCAFASDIEELATDWLSDTLLLKDKNHFDFVKRTVEFDNFKQKEYEVIYQRKLTKALSFQANINKNTSRSTFGVLQQKLNTKEFELSSWWASDKYRIGVKQKVVMEREMTSITAQEISLPTNRSLAMFIELSGLLESHLLLVSLQRDSWKSKNEFLAPSKFDNQNNLAISYAIAF